MSVDSIREYLVQVILKNHRYLDLNNDDLNDFAEIITDNALIYRFYKKHKENKELAEAAILSHLDWRLNENIAGLDLKTVDEGTISYIQQGLFRFGKFDVQGRPIVYIKPKLYIPTSTKNAESFKNTMILLLETLRRWIYVLSKGDITILHQAIAVVDLNGFGVSHMDFELVPIVYDILKHQYPQLLGQVLVLNYGWIHAGIWSFLRTMLTEEAKSKLLFLSNDELKNYIPTENLNLEFGGLDPDSSKDPQQCPILQTFTEPLHTKIQSNEFYHLSSLLVDRLNLLPPTSVSSSSDIFYDALSTPKSPKIVKSAADLQALLPSYQKGGAGRNASAISLGSLARTKSNLQLHRNASFTSNTNETNTIPIRVPTPKRKIVVSNNTPTKRISTSIILGYLRGMRHFSTIFMIFLLIFIFHKRK